MQRDQRSTERTLLHTNLMDKNSSNLSDRASDVYPVKVVKHLHHQTFLIYYLDIINMKSKAFGMTFTAVVNLGAFLSKGANTNISSSKQLEKLSW